MKAIIRYKYGTSEVLKLREAEIPKCKNNEVLVKVFATTINRSDIAAVAGKPRIIRLFTGLFKPKYESPGTDFAGTIKSIGANVTKFKIGDRVCGFNDIGIGSQRQFMAISEKANIIRMPSNINFQEAASLFEGAHYALNMLKYVNLKPDDTAMVIGGTGAIGSALIQLLAEKEIKTDAVCEGKDIELVQNLGAKKAFDFKTEDFTETGIKYDYIFDTVGKSSFGKCKPNLLEKGIYISSELGPGNENIYLPITSLFSKKKVKFPVPKNVKMSLEVITDLTSKDKFNPLIDEKVFSLEDIRSGYDYVASGKKKGNVVINFH